MKISKKVRDEAILICAIAASGGVTLDRGYGTWKSVAYGTIREALGVRMPALQLAILAWTEVGRSYPLWTRELDAEAAAILTEGWSP